MPETGKPPAFGLISVVTPTLRRPGEVADLMTNLGQQEHLPFELILVDGAPQDETDTEVQVRKMEDQMPFKIRYTRHGGGTAIQRNIGIDDAIGDFIAFIDDDIRLHPDFFKRILDVFAADRERTIGGITGYITNAYFDQAGSARWRWYRRLNMFTTYEPGRYDFETGYPINRYMQPPHEELKAVDFMGAGCAVWRREVLDSGLRFSAFFTDFGVLEDAHFALRAGRRWKLIENGKARCVHLHSPSSRENARLIAHKSAVNYRYVFMDIVPKRTWTQECRFWRVQFFDLVRFIVYAFRHSDRNSWLTVLGKIEGIFAAARLCSPGRQKEQKR